MLASRENETEKWKSFVDWAEFRTKAGEKKLAETWQKEVKWHLLSHAACYLLYGSCNDGLYASFTADDAAVWGQSTTGTAVHSVQDQTAGSREHI
jgi:hypothetical protein